MKRYDSHINYFLNGPILTGLIRSAEICGGRPKWVFVSCVLARFAPQAAEEPSGPCSRPGGTAGSRPKKATSGRGRLTRTEHTDRQREREKKTCHGGQRSYFKIQA